MSSNDLRGVFQEAFDGVSPSVKEYLAYKHLIALSDAFEGWAHDRRLSPEQSSRMIGMSERLRELADEVGPNWNPPIPRPLPLLAFVARKLLDE